MKIQNKVDWYQVYRPSINKSGITDRLHKLLLVSTVLILKSHLQTRIRIKANRF